MRTGFVSIPLNGNLAGPASNNEAELETKKDLRLMDVLNDSSMMKRQIAYTLDSRADSIQIRFEPFHEGKVDAIRVPCICDYDQTGQLIGVEILRFGSLIGANALDMSGSDQRQNGWITFDQRADAFYLKLGAVKSVRQIAASAMVLLDPEHRLTGLSLGKPRAQKPAS